MAYQQIGRGGASALSSTRSGVRRHPRRLAVFDGTTVVTLLTALGLPATRAIVYDDPLLGGAETAPLSATLLQALDDARSRPQVSEALRAVADGYLRRGEMAGEDELRKQLEAAEEGRNLTG